MGRRDERHPHAVCGDGTSSLIPLAGKPRPDVVVTEGDFWLLLLLLLPSRGIFFDRDDDDEWPKHSLYGPDVDEDKIARGGISSGEDSPNTSVNKRRSREPNQAAAAASAAAAKRIAAKKLDTPPRARRHSAPHIDIRPPAADAAVGMRM